MRNYERKSDNSWCIFMLWNIINMKFFVLLQLLFDQIIGYRAVRDFTTSSEECKTRPVMFDTRNTSVWDSPRFVELHRCMGFDVGYAVNYRCVSTTSTHLNITLGSTQVHIVYTSVCDEMCLRGWGALDKMCTRSHGFRRLLLLTMVLLAYYPVGNITAGIILQYCIFVL